MKMLDYSGLKVAVIGDFMLDIWEYGEVLRPNPEAPEIPDFVSHSYTESAGGAGYLSSLIVGLGAQCHPVTVLGDDCYRDRLVNALDADGIEIEGIYTCGKRRTTTKTRFMVDDKPIGLRWSVETHDPPCKYCTDHIIAHTCGEWFKTFDAIIFCDYNKGVCSKEIIKAVMQRCKNAGVPVFVDPKFDNFWEYKGATIFKPNWKEAKAAVRGRLNLINAQVVANEIIMGLGSHVVITKGAAGLLVVKAESGVSEGFKAHDVKAVDVTGAGDAVMAVLSLEYLRNGGDIFGAAELANWAGALAVQQHGTATITVKDLEEYYEQSGVSG